MFATIILVPFYRYDRVTPSGFKTLEYSWVKDTIGICTIADYSVAKKRQQRRDAEEGGMAREPVWRGSWYGAWVEERLTEVEGQWWCARQTAKVRWELGWVVAGAGLWAVED
jgi:hypothetical protein